MSILRLDHTVVVVEDLEDAVAFFTALGMLVEGSGELDGEWIDKVNGLEGVRVSIVLLRTPDGNGRLELTRFHSPELVKQAPWPQPPNALGLRSVMFEVESLDESLDIASRHGAELMGEVAQYLDQYRLCYLRGPGGAIVALAEDLRKKADSLQN
jgi:catechol 2,3-dioxygenase-like lactoylglutathione lyase family enzyme